MGANKLNLGHPKDMAISNTLQTPSSQLQEPSWDLPDTFILIRICSKCKGLCQENFGLKKLKKQKIIQSQTISVKKLWPQKIFGHKKVWLQKYVG